MLKNKQDMMKTRQNKQEQESKTSRFQKFNKNVCWGACLLLLLSLSSVVKVGNTPVLSHIKSALHEDFYQNLGRLTFVNALLPSATQVFFMEDNTFVAPCFGSIVHNFSQEEPYIGYGVYKNGMYPIMKGEVLSVSYDQKDTYKISLHHPNNLSSSYHNLSKVYVKEGDYVTNKTKLGEIKNNHAALLYTYHKDHPIDIQNLLCERED